MPINKSESTKIVDLTEELKELPRNKRRNARTAIGELIVEEINSFLDRSLSPVSGGPFKRSKADKTASKLFEDGDMRSQITFEEHRKGVKVGIFREAPEVERLKSFNHNVGDTLPARQFVPRPDEEFKRSIKAKIRAKIKELKDEDGNQS
jgi:hypothetical protein